jgi:hypothetical protein
MVVTAERTGRASAARLLGKYSPAAPAFVAVSLMLVWAWHDGGYDADTWYWGALLLLAVLAAVAIATPVRVTPAARAALLAFALYVAWSYLSITWAASPGDALQGSNRSLMYLIVFALFTVTPLTARRMSALLLTFTLGIGAIGALELVRLAGNHAAGMFSEGRLVSPTGYFNATAALFTIGALLAVALSVRRELSPVLRGLLLAFACGDLQLALLAQSRGWLFTLPFVLLAALGVVHDRLRVAAAALLPTVGTLAVLSPLLAVFRAHGGHTVATPALIDAAAHAGTLGLFACAGVLVAGSVLAASESRLRGPQLSRASRRAIAGVALTVAVAAAVVGTLAATHGHPVRFLDRQWHGFTHPTTTSSGGSHFAVVGSGRYDMWRVALDAFRAHPIGGLGQDNFGDYYLVHRRTSQEPAWTHSFELRLLAHNGIVGTALFAVFLVAAITAALRIRRRAEDVRTRALAGAALLPLVVWLIHGSVDWFWEMPALTGPALGFLGAAISLGGSGAPNAVREPGRPASAVRRRAGIAAGALALAAATIVLGLPYLAVREVSTAGDIAHRHPGAALSDLRTAADLNPLSADPGRLGGTIALQHRLFGEAERRFGQAIARQPGGWYAWLGRGLASSALGDSARARHDYAIAARINKLQPAVRQALARVDSTGPLTPAQAFRLLVLTG